MIVPLRLTASLDESLQYGVPDFGFGDGAAGDSGV